MESNRQEMVELSASCGRTGVGKAADSGLSVTAGLSGIDEYCVQFHVLSFSTGSRMADGMVIQVD